MTVKKRAEALRDAAVKARSDNYWMDNGLDPHFVLAVLELIGVTP